MIASILLKFPYSFSSVSVLCFQSKPLFKNLMFLLLYYFTSHSKFQNMISFYIKMFMKL